MDKLKGLPVVLAKDRKSWRNWLKRNHAKEKCAWLVFYKNSVNVKNISYEDAVEEALCFGWIDSKKMKRDDEGSYQYFSRRRLRSKWSSSNRERAERMIQAGLMTASGQEVIDVAKKTGTWEALAEVENGSMPEDLAARFHKNKKALKNFEAFAPSARRMMLQWILDAKRPDTRKKRIERVVTEASNNVKAYP